MRPDLFAYLNYRLFLRDWFDWRKAENPRYSYRVFARMAGLRSSSLLVHVINQERNLTASSTESFIKAMRLGEEEGRFFRDLVELDQGETPDLRSEAFQRISAVRRFKSAHKIEGEAFRCLSRWYYAAIHELVSTAGFVDDPAWIAQTLRPQIKPEEAAQALSELITLGLLVRDEEGVHQAEASLVTPNEVLGLAVHNYHRGVSNLAAGSITAFLPDRRHLLGVTVSISEAMIPILKDELNALQARILDLCDSEPVTADAVYQINLQLFPLSSADAEE